MKWEWTKHENEINYTKFKRHPETKFETNRCCFHATSQILAVRLPKER
jgi:hypothetical protein